MKIGYARASITDPDLAAQEDALKKAGCERVFTEKPDRVSLVRDGAIDAVPALGELVRDARGRLVR